MERAMLTANFLLLCLASVNALTFVKECIPNGGKDIKFPVPCCPYYDGSICGEKQNRGKCLPVMQSRAMLPPDINLDERYNNLQFFYNMTCQCTGTFDGPNCGECKPGYKGKNCDESYKIVRKEFRQLSEAEFKKYLAALHLCKSEIDPIYYILRTVDRFRSSLFQFIDASYLDVWCFCHYYATLPFINNTRERFITNYAHGSTGFLTWHRYALLKLDKQLQRCMGDPYIGIHYYDWRDDTDCALCNKNYFGETDSTGFLASSNVVSEWRAVCSNYDFSSTSCLMSDSLCERPRITRRVGRSLTVTKPTRLDVTYCLSQPNLDTYPYNTEVSNSFRNCLEGFRNRFGNAGTSMHNAFHVYIGGTMAEVPLSCNDPLFAAHHAFVDKLLEEYIKRNNIRPDHYPQNNTIYGHGSNDCVQPFLGCWRHKDVLVPCDWLGYMYSVNGDI